MISLLILGLVSARAETAGHLKGAFHAGPTTEVLIHAATQKQLVIRNFGDRTPVVCELMLRASETAHAFGRDTTAGLHVEAEFTPGRERRDYNGYVRAKVGGAMLAVFPHELMVDTVSIMLNAPYDLGQLSDVEFTGPLAIGLETLLKTALKLESSPAHGERTFAAHGKLDARGRFVLEGASVLVKNLFSDGNPFLTVVTGVVEPAPTGFRITTRTGRALKVLEGPALREIDLPGAPGPLVRATHAFREITLLGLQNGGDLKLLRTLAD